MRIKILVRLKGQILEPQGKVIEQSLNSLGFTEFSNIRHGKLIELYLHDNVCKDEKVQKIYSTLFSTRELAKSLIIQ